MFASCVSWIINAVLCEVKLYGNYVVFVGFGKVKGGKCQKDVFQFFGLHFLCLPSFLPSLMEFLINRQLMRQIS